MKPISYSKAAIRTLRRMPANTASRIRLKIREYAADPSTQANNVKALQGRTEIRLRVGDWRGIMDDGEILAVLEIGASGNIYDEWTTGRSESDMNEMVTIPREEYDRLRAAAEDLADISAYERVRADLATGREELIPAAFVDRMIDGESPVRVFREWRGQTQSSLARASGVNRVQIADIEAGRSKGSVETMRKLAEALKLTIDDLV